MSDARSDLAQACRRAEQETIAAIRAGSASAERAHQALALLHIARAQDLLRMIGIAGSRMPEPMRLAA